MRPAHVLARLLRVSVPVALLTSLVGTVTAANAVPPVYPSATITSPAKHATWTGLQAVYATVATDPAGTDYPASSQLYVDGVSVSQGLAGCEGSASTKSCAEHYLWDASGLSGSHLAHVTLTTHDGVVKTSADLAIDVVSPPPSVTIDYPAAGATVGGSDVYVDATGTMDASQQGDQPSSMSLLVDGTAVDTQTCDHTARTCTPTFDWGTVSSVFGSHSLTVTMTTVHGITGTSAARQVTLVDLPVPVVTITSPAANAVVSGTVDITATGSVANTYGDAPTLMGLFVDGNLVGPTQDCPATGACTLTFPWNSTGSYGAHEIVVALLSQQYVEGDSAPLILTVRVAQPPTVVINSPAARDTVLSSTTVSATATLDPLSQDRAVDMQLMVDGATYGTPVACSSDATTTCTVSLPWTPQGLLGSHNIAVRLDTTKTEVTSPLRQVFVSQYSQAGATKLTFGMTQDHSVINASGIVTDLVGRPLPGVVVTVTVDPAVGRTTTLTATTAADGSYVVSLGKRPATDAVVTATLPADYGSLTVQKPLGAQPVLKCGIPRTVKHAVTITVTCTLPYAPKGLKATLSSAGKKGVHVLAHASAKNGKFTFSFKIAGKAQRLRLWVVVANSHTFRYGPVSAPVNVHVI